MVDTIEAVDGSMERAKKYEGITLGAFLATLTISVIVFVAQAALGLTLPSLYNCKDQWQGWKCAYRTMIMPPEDTLKNDDASLFLRYVLVLAKVSGVLSFTLSPILASVYSLYGPADRKGLDKFVWTTTENRYAYWAPLVLTVGTVVFTCWVIWHELKYFVRFNEKKAQMQGQSLSFLLLRCIPAGCLRKEAVDGLLDGLPPPVKTLGCSKGARGFGALKDLDMKSHKDVDWSPSPSLGLALTTLVLRFNSVVSPQTFQRALARHYRGCSVDRVLSMDDIVWKNIDMNHFATRSRTLHADLAVVLLTFIFAAPIAVLGLISQLAHLSALSRNLQWIGDVPSWLMSIIQGVVPSLAATLLVQAFAIILRKLILYRGDASFSSMERSVQRFFFAFLFGNILIVASIGAGLANFMESVRIGTMSTVLALAENIPKSANYFYSYILLQGFSIGGSALAQFSVLANGALGYVRARRTAPGKKHTPIKLELGTVYPVITMLACIGTTYSIIAPLIQIALMSTFVILYCSHKYSLIYLQDAGPRSGGSLFPTAVTQLLVGVYALELAMLALFLLAQDSDGRIVCGPQATIMSVVLVSTLLFNVAIQRILTPQVELFIELE